MADSLSQEVCSPTRDSTSFLYRTITGPRSSGHFQSLSRVHLIPCIFACFYRVRIQPQVNSYFHQHLRETDPSQDK